MADFALGWLPDPEDKMDLKIIFTHPSWTGYNGECGPMERPNHFLFRVNRTEGHDCYKSESEPLPGLMVTKR
jgi:hypothetical protein